MLTLLLLAFSLHDLLFWLLLLCLLGKYLLCLILDFLITLETSLQGGILLVRNLGTEVGVVSYLAQVLVVFQEINCRLKSYIQFC